MAQPSQNDNQTSGTILAGEKIFFSNTLILTENSGFILNAANLVKNTFGSGRIILLAVSVLFLSGQQANADPVGDFFKKVGTSISKAFQPQPEERQTKKTAKRLSRRSNIQESNVARVAPSPFGEVPPPVQKETLPPTVLRASAAPPEKAKGDMPYGIPIPGRKGLVTSPYLPDGTYIDVSAFAPATPVKDPYTGKIFLVP